MKIIIPKNKRESGFTLVEVLAVIMVIGILALVSLPIYIQIKPRLALNAEIRNMASDLRYAQQLSVTEQINYSVVFDKANSEYTIINSSNSQITKTRVIDPAIAIESITDLSSDTVTFNVTGAALQTGSITLINANNATSTISIKPSGYVKIEQ